MNEPSHERADPSARSLGSLFCNIHFVSNSIKLRQLYFTEFATDENRIVKEIAGDINTNIRFQATALSALQEIAESQLVMWFEMGYKCMIIVDLIQVYMHVCMPRGKLSTPKTLSWFDRYSVFGTQLAGWLNLLKRR